LFLLLGKYKEAKEDFTYVIEKNALENRGSRASRVVLDSEAEAYFGRALIYDMLDEDEKAKADREMGNQGIRGTLIGHVQRGLRVKHATYPNFAADVDAYIKESGLEPGSDDYIYLTSLAGEARKYSGVKHLLPPVYGL
jgi:hypothetical protein